MSDNAAFDPDRHFPAAGVRFRVNPSWALYQDIGPESGYVYQPIADTHGTVFVRYGPDATVEASLARLGNDLPTPPVLVADQRLDVHGLAARRVHLVQDRGTPKMYTSGPAGPEHRLLPAGRAVYVAVGFEAMRVPVLAGYDVPETALETLSYVLEDIIASVQPDAPV
jgi:hypothetical protein